MQKSVELNVVLSKSRAYDMLFTKMRDINTCTEDFVKYSRRAMHLLAEDALAELPVTNVAIQTPCGPCEGVCPPPPSEVTAVSIVRSGDCLVDVVRSVEPGVHVGKILVQRDEASNEKWPKHFYTKLPPGIATHYVLLCDPMLATGGSALTALNVLCQQYGVNPSRIVFVNLICSPEGLRTLAQAYPSVKIVTAKIDSHLNEAKYIVPGLGDFGDRYYGTN